MKQATWKIIDRGAVPESAVNHVEVTCQSCGHEALLPVLGLAIAQLDFGIIFDVGEHALPAIIQCRKCRRQFELDPYVR